MSTWEGKEGKLEAEGQPNTIHEISNDTFLSVPQTFGDNTISWMMTGDELTKFLECAENEFLLGPTFKNNNKNITFQLRIYPNGMEYKSRGRVQLVVGIKSASETLSVRAYVELFCCETMSSYKQNIKLDHKENSVENQNNRRYNYSRSNENNMIGWGATQLTLSQCRQYKSLTFGCKMEILQIHCEKSNISIDYDKQIKINEKVKQTFYIHHDERLIFSAEPIAKKFYSPRFGVNKNWCLVFTTMDETGNAKLSLKVLSLPPKMCKMEIDVSLNCDHSKVYRQFKSSPVSMWTSDKEWIIKESDLRIPFFRAKRIGLSVGIKITKVFAYDSHFNKNVLVPRYLWFKYGIVAPKKNAAPKKNNFDVTGAVIIFDQILTPVIAWAVISVAILFWLIYNYVL